MIDDAFLRIESRRQPFHIGVLMLFDPGQQEPGSLVSDIVEKLSQSTSAVEPFNRRLVTLKGLHYWVDDSQFDINQHFVHISLPKPGRILELLQFVSRVHASHVDRAYPLWRLYLIEGIEDGRFAIYLKFHHAMMDGVAAIGLVTKAMSTDPEQSRQMPAIWQNRFQKSPTRNESNGKSKSINIGQKSLRDLSQQGARFLKPLAADIKRSLDDFRSDNPNQFFFGQAPRSIFNGRISASRRFAAQSYATARLRAVATHLDATLNDVVLALCGSALRQYLKMRNELPEEPLIAAIPVSTRQKGDDNFDNKVSFTLTQLGTHLDDPVARLKRIKQCMDYSKQQLRDLSPNQKLTSAVLKLVPGALNTALGLRPDHSLASLCISHVPGPREDLYWQGAKLCGLYPISLLTDGGAVNITIVSRHDHVDFGILACSKTVPQMQRLIDYLENGLVELERALPNKEMKVIKARQPELVPC